jgi:hypothetical protein
MLVKTLKSVTLYYISLRTLLKKYVLNCNLRLRQPYNYVNQRQHFMLKLVPINMLISINIASIRLIKHTKNADRAKNKAYTKNIVQRIYTTEEDTREVIKEIKHSDKRSAMFIIS